MLEEEMNEHLGRENNEKVKADREEDKEINYTDTTGILMNSVKTIVNAVTYVLIAFVSISLVVSSIMIGIITYIIGLLSGLLGIGTTYLLIPVINTILHHFTGNIPLAAALNVNNAIILIALSVVLTLIGGLIPAKAAPKRDPVIALRTE